MHSNLIIKYCTRRILMQSIKDATPRIILKHDLKEADAVQYM